MFDRREVAPDAERFLAAVGVRERVAFVGGDFFESVPPGGDVYLLRSVLHDWSDAECARILENCRRAISAGGVVLIVELAGGDVGSPRVALSDLMMLVMETGRERSADEYAALLRRAGLSLSREITVGASHLLLEAVAT